MKYLLINAPAFEIYNSPSIGIPNLLSILKSNNIQTQYIDLNTNYISKLLTRNYLESILKTSQEINKDKNLKNLIISKKNIINFLCFILKNKTYFYNHILFEYAYINLFQLIENFQNCILKNFDEFKINKINDNYLLNIDKLKLYIDNNQFFICNYYNEILPYILQKEPNCIGISINTEIQFFTGLILAYKIKQLSPLVHINIGGCFFKQNLQEKVQNISDIFSFFFNSISIKNNTKTITDIIKYLQNEIKIEEIPNFIYKENNKIKINTNEENIPINKLPFPLFDDYNKEEYYCPELIIPVEASKSCYWGKCIYCNFCKFEKYSAKSAESFVNEIEFLKNKYKTNYFIFWDNSFHPDLIDKVSELLIEKKLDIQYCIYARLEEKFNLKLLKKMRESGCRRIQWGLDSASKKVLKNINKGIDINKVKQILKDSTEAGIFNFVYLLLGNPTETREDLEENLKFIKNNKKNIQALGIFPNVSLNYNSEITLNYSYYSNLFYTTQKERNYYKNKILKEYGINDEDIFICQYSTYFLLYLQKYNINQLQKKFKLYKFLKPHNILIDLYVKFYHLKYNAIKSLRRNKDE